ncbi:hypothetical protein DPMN_062760 [Dreissena polymorpha]|uniref:Uncharacterized protein n=1 Tax=Dreissena polymorpha TaxID=45954 RepID=A0A9D4C995_DREPO|nr:hypothetical protein DPMN_062760 [Dreissena polymorpha]
MNNIPESWCTQGGRNDQRFTDHLQQDLADKEWPTPWTQSVFITLPKKGNLQLCKNYISASSVTPARSC